MLALSGAIILAVGGGARLPDLHALALIGGASVFGISAYAALTQAMRTGEVSVVAPFRYTRLLFAMLLGVAVFAERPDTMTLLGSAIIVACGLAILTQKRR
jgi:drug/metabolite transporter (DMT)-like permease